MSRPAPLIVVSGTGTSIGKTFCATGLVGAWGSRGQKIVGYKPIESGVDDLSATDAHALSATSTFHVKHPLPHARLKAPLSPHVAARLEGAILDLTIYAAAIAAARQEADGVLVELPGGLFSPVTDEVLAIDFAKMLAPTAIVLVVVDRLGVLHDAISASEAARPRGTSVTHVLLNSPESADASTGSNAAELSMFVAAPVFGPVARGAVDSPAFAALIAAIDPLATSS